MGGTGPGCWCKGGVSVQGKGGPEAEWNRDGLILATQACIKILSHANCIGWWCKLGFS